MMRRIIGANRRPDEDWISWVQRATREVEEHMKRLNAKAWTEMYMDKKARWAEKLCKMSSERWAWKITS